MISKNRKVVEELKIKQEEEYLGKKEQRKDESLQEIEERKSLSSEKKKKVTKKAKAPKQKKSGFLAWFSGKWKGLFSHGNKENEKNEKKKDPKSEKIVNFSERKVREHLSIEEQAELADNVNSIKSILTKRKDENGGDHQLEFEYIYEDEQALIEGCKKANLDDEEKEAVKDYTSGAHNDMNAYLRGTKSDVPKKYKKKAKMIKNLMQRTVIPKDTAVIRMIYPEHLHLILGRSEPYKTTEEAYNELSKEAGKTRFVFREKGICSTSTEPKGSLFFSILPVEMRILLPKGSHGLYIEHSGFCWPGERELLLAPDTDFQLIGVEKDKVFNDYKPQEDDKRNMGDTKLIMYLKVLPKETKESRIAA